MTTIKEAGGRSQEAGHPRLCVWVFVNGILAFPGKSQGWTDRAVTWLQCRRVGKAEKWEYFSGPFTRRLRQQSRARKIATLMGYYQEHGIDVILVGHSNGCDLIARVLALRGTRPWYYRYPVRSAHLFAAAADWSDFRTALDVGHLHRLHLYGSDNDGALKLARLSRLCFGWLGLGYGSLGLQTAEVEYEDRVAGSYAGRAPRVFDHANDAYGHSDWFDRGARFEATMVALVRNETLHAPELV